MFRNTDKRHFRAGVTVAALALTVAACPAQAQFNSISGPNSFFPTGPRVLSPLGGGVLGNQNFNTQFALNPQFTAFNNQLLAFNRQRAAAQPEFADYNAILANYNAQRTAYNANVARFNSAPNVPLSNFGSPQDFVFSGTAFNQVNPSLNTSTMSGNGSIGFNGFNSFNALNNFSGFQAINNSVAGFGTLNNGFGGTGVPVTTGQVQRVTRAKPAFNPTLPNPPLSGYPTASRLAMAHSASNAQAGTTGNPSWTNLTPYPDRLYPANRQMAGTTAQTTQGQVPWWTNLSPYPDRLYIANRAMQANQTRWPNLSPYPDRLYIANRAMQADQTRWPNLSPYPDRLFIAGQTQPINMNPYISGYGGTIGSIRSAPHFGYPAVIGGSKTAFGAGLGGGATVMGGRAR